MGGDDQGNTETLVRELTELREEIEAVHRELLERLSALCCTDGYAARCTACSRPCKQGAHVTVTSCPSFDPLPGPHTDGRPRPGRA